MSYKYWDPQTQAIDQYKASQRKLEEEQKRKKDEIPIKIGQYGMQLTEMLNKTSDTAIKNLGIVENNPDLFQYDVGHGMFESVPVKDGLPGTAWFSEKFGGRPGYLANATRTPLQRISVKPDVTVSAAKEALGDNFDKFLTEKYNVDPDKFNLSNILKESPNSTVLQQSAPLDDMVLSDAITKGGKEILGEGGKSALGTAGKVASGAGVVLSGISAYDEFEKGNTMEGINDAVRMSYPWLSAAGPVGWLGMGVNELIDILS